MEKMNRGNIFMVLFLLLVVGVVIVGEAQRSEELPKITIINETYEPKHIGANPINKNYSIVMTKTPLNLNS